MAESGSSSSRIIGTALGAIALVAVVVVIASTSSPNTQPDASTSSATSLAAPSQLSADDGCVPPTRTAWRIPGWENHMDGHLKSDHATQPIFGMNSYHSNHNEDRRYRFYRAEFHRPGGIIHHDWSNWLNGWDQTFGYTCPHNQVVFGVESYHDNGKEDRRWKVRCGEMVNVKIKPQAWSGWTNAMDKPQDFRCPYGQVVIGLYSKHYNSNEDRMWKIKCGRMCAPLNCRYKIIDGDWSQDTSRQGDVYKYSVSETEHNSRERTDAQKEKTTNSLLTAKMDAEASTDWISKVSASASTEVKSWSNELTNQWKEVTKSSRTINTKYSFTRAPSSTQHVFTWKLHVQFTGGNPKCARNMWITPGVAGHPYEVHSTTGEKPKCYGGKCTDVKRCNKCMGNQWMFKWARDNQNSAIKDKNSAEWFENAKKLERMEAWLKTRGQTCEGNVHCRALKAKVGA